MWHSQSRSPCELHPVIRETGRDPRRKRLAVVLSLPPLPKGSRGSLGHSTELQQGVRTPKNTTQRYVKHSLDRPIRDRTTLYSGPMTNTSSHFFFWLFPPLCLSLILRCPAADLPLRGRRLLGGSCVGHAARCRRRHPRRTREAWPSSPLVFVLLERREGEGEPTRTNVSPAPGARLRFSWDWKKEATHKS